jgi:hypothetical protein
MEGGGAATAATATVVRDAIEKLPRKADVASGKPLGADLARMLPQADSGTAAT